MKFKVKVKSCKLWGLKSREWSWEGGINSTFPSIDREKWLLLQLNLETKVACKEQLAEDLALLLKQFSMVFEEPKGLPPSRCKYHQIVLKEGTPPIYN